MTIPILYARGALALLLASPPPSPSFGTPALPPVAAATRSVAVEVVASATTVPADTLQLARLQALAVAGDARRASLELEREASSLREGNLGVARLPQFLLRGDASYQSEVIELPISSPSLSVPPAPQERYELGLDADWTVWDGGRTQAARAAEQARLAGTVAGLDAALFSARAEVTEAFFSALLLQEQIRELDVLIDDLEVRVEEMRARVESGLALSGALASLRAEVLGARQQRDALSSERRVALAILASLSGETIDDSAVLALPDLGPEMAAHTVDDRDHPQFALFAAQRDLWSRQAEVIEVGARPALSVFGQLNLGSPGYAQFDESIHEYWRAGLRVQWAPWDWNRRDREVAEMRVQQQVIDAQEEHFSDQLLRLLERPVRTMEYMRTALESDDEIIALREQAESHARAQFEERAISVSAYTTARTDLQEARIARLRHRTELVRAQAIYLITLGVELR